MWQQVVSLYPEMASAVSGGVSGILDASGLDEKTKQLVYIAVQTAACYTLAVQYHVPLALKAGATRDEIIGSALIASAATGPKGFVTCFSAILEVLE